MEAPRPWLGQGDIFEQVPIFLAQRDAGGVHVPVPATEGPALLVTFDCVLDKRSRMTPRVKRFHFLPLVAVAAQPQQRQDLVRANGLTPYELIYVGDIPTLGGEFFAILGEVYSVPAKHFAHELHDYQGQNPASPPGEPNLRLTSGDNRLGSLDTTELDLLRDKWNAYWTQRLPNAYQQPRSMLAKLRSLLSTRPLGLTPNA